MQGPQETPSETSETSEVLSPTDLRAITDVIPATPSVTEMSRPSVEIGLTSFRFTEFSGSKKAIQSKEIQKRTWKINYISYTTKDQKSQRKTSLSEKKVL